MKLKKKKKSNQNLNDNEIKKQIKNIKMKCIHCKKMAETYLKKMVIY